MIWSVAWRNIWRNRQRSMVILAAIAIGIFAGVFTWAFYRGMMNQRVQNAIITESSHIQIHHKNYLTDPDKRYFIPWLDSIRNRVDHLPHVKAASSRTVINAMITSAETGSGVKLTGIEPETERRVTNLFSKVKEGSYFGGNHKTPIVIGSALAEKLSVKLRSKLVVTCQAMDGTIVSVLFRVEGIYKTSNTGFDELNVYVRARDLNQMVGLDPEAGHELAILLDDNELADSTAASIRREYPGLDTRTWREIMPEVSLVEESMDVSMYVFMAVILAALIFGIINTMLMAVLERMKELGMLMAIGMNKFRVFMMIFLETVMLSLTGGFAGIAVGYGVTIFFNHHGIDLSHFARAYERLGYESIIYPVANADIDLKVTLMVLVTGMLASLYPAWKAIRLDPAEAIRVDV